MSVALLLACAPLRAEPAPALASLVNAYRGAPAQCQGRAAPALPALKPEPLLSRVRLGAGTMPVAALEAAGYRAEVVDVVEVTGPTEASAAFEALRNAHCPALLGEGYAAIGAQRNGATWSVVLARPMPELTLTPEGWPEAGRAILAATNAARAHARMCGDRRFEAAPVLAWSEALAQAAYVHSKDMISHRSFSHQGSDGSDAGSRARAAGYSWHRIGENIASGPYSVEQAMEGWLSSPGHCANLMNPAFTEMGAAYAMRGGAHPNAYWTQDFGMP